MCPQSYQVPPFPLGIPPMVCKQAPAFTQPPTYCDDNTPLPDDIKTVAFFYNLGIHVSPRIYQIYESGIVKITITDPLNSLIKCSTGTIVQSWYQAEVY